jgi:tetrahedral aminopeptidase
MKSLLQKLVSIAGPSGYEADIRSAIQAEIEPLADEVTIDALGNLIARKGDEGQDGKRIMLAAHMDEIGIIATHIDEQGFIRFTNVGGIRRHTSIGSQVRFLDGTLGVIGYEHLEDANRLPTLDHMYVDVGAKSREDCPVRIGDSAVFEQPFLDLGDRLVSKAMDDRVGVTILVETMRQLDKIPHQVYFVFSVQEEVGVRGAMTAAYRLEPDLGIALDVTRSGDTPKGIKMAVDLGKGPAIKVRDSGMLADPRVVDWMVRSAEGAGLPYQLEVLEIGSTDARAIQISRSGVPVGCISIPCRYIHAPVEMVDYNDVQNAVGLLAALLNSPAKFD